MNLNELINHEYWPENPYPESIFPMTKEQYIKAVPDEKLRTAISGFLMREGFKVAEQDIIDFLREVDDNDY